MIKFHRDKLARIRFHQLNRMYTSISYTGFSYQSILSHITHVRVRFQITTRIPFIPIIPRCLGQSINTTAVLYCLNSNVSDDLTNTIALRFDILSEY
ncbi:hypothetical protein QL285_074839 [Trifolium repens]|nr:hypothetical protein QL285_074839 [Trifolium repens]